VSYGSGSSTVICEWCFWCLDGLFFLLFFLVIIGGLPALLLLNPKRLCCVNNENNSPKRSEGFWGVEKWMWTKLGSRGLSLDGIEESTSAYGWVHCRLAHFIAIRGDFSCLSWWKMDVYTMARVVAEKMDNHHTL
jgi:hypothetical protein